VAADACADEWAGPNERHSVNQGRENSVNRSYGLDPTKKMSKSDETGRSVVSPQEARKKVMSAATDSRNEIQYDYNERPRILDIPKTASA
jgi:tryptophanyl-tRNA synthetase